MAFTVQELIELLETLPDKTLKIYGESQDIKGVEIWDKHDEDSIYPIAVLRED